MVRKEEPVNDGVPVRAACGRAGARAGSEPAALVPALRPGECHVWWADPDRVSGRFRDLLDRDERIRYAQYRNSGDRRRFLAGRVLLRHVAAGYLRVLPWQVRLAARCPDCARPHGRPTLPGSGIEVSLAHSGRRVALAATRAGPVGVDVELIDPSVRIDALLPRVLAPEEREFAAAWAPDDFYRMWTRKEAVLKATGDGLRVPLSDVAVSSPAAGARLIRPPGSAARTGAFVLADLDVPAGYAAAAAVVTSGPIRFTALDAGPLLATGAAGRTPDGRSST
jgi:4'-phosphopantetheinyl transferase